MSRPHRPGSGIRSAWWCEFSTRTPAFGDGDERVLLRAQSAETPTQVMVWIRLAVRVLLSGFDPRDTERAYHWLDHGQWEAVARLADGEPYAFTAAAGRTHVEWSARPVLFLPLAHTATGPLGRCAEPALCACTARGHRCGGHRR
ncbi:hypothetical protein RM550_10495 [Streptomyces sp. DSM 41527]|uniref:Uncharacterized protein n=1 Tax=Streptomyces mooreae TaxID=3075523 RepID=A0ABU2T593_9ACTN|nr:hypothetical protein [Streptomyces sp. DSM 41527]MDT0456168.1 hypothetical protein [Streptomyces sp. DSM 41527]